MAAITTQDIDHTVKGHTLARAFLATVESRADAVALRWRDGEGWGEWTWADYAERVARIAGGLAARGVGPGQRVVLMMRNTPEFHVLDMAALMCGATPISIYNSSSPDQVAYLVGHCEAALGVVEDDSFLARFHPVREELPALRSLGVVSAGDTAADFTWDDLLGSEPMDLHTAVEVGQPDDLATVIYTSGTTGPPKGVMISNYNACWTVECLRLTFGWGPEEFAGKRLVSYLPMAHIAERMTSHYQHVSLGTEVTCCPDPGQVAPYAREVRPHVMFGVPRVWEKIHAGVMAAMASRPEQAAAFAGAVEAAKPIRLKMAWDDASDDDRETYAGIDEAAFRPVREMLGFDHLRVAITGAAPIPSDLLGWYHAIGVPMSEIYGMSESSGPMTWTPFRIKPGTVGPAIAGCEVKLADDGEVICKGGNVFKGYLNQPDKTAETVQDGWLRSGDIGEVDDDGYFRIVDRKKELIITAGGKNISPANLETALKSVPLIGQACAIGDQRPFVSALVVLDPDAAPVWAKHEGIEFSDLGDLATNPKVVSAVEREVADVMGQFNNAERVKKVRVLGDEWLPDSEELTPTSKLKRRGIHAKYAAAIETLYAR